MTPTRHWAGDHREFLLTSGSTGKPKAVVTPQRMICANQVMLSDTLAFLKASRVIIDWLPWITPSVATTIRADAVQRRSMYLDGEADALRHRQTVRNLREISPTVYFNVPRVMIAAAVFRDTKRAGQVLQPAACDVFSGAALSAHVGSAGRDRSRGDGAAVRC